MIGNRNGFTIMEVLAAIALMGVVTYGIVTGTAALFKAESQTGSLSDESKMIQSVIENITSDPALYQKNFAAEAATSLDALLAPKTLPLAFGPNYFGPREGCDRPNKCIGYIGYVLRPANGARGLFEATLRVAKPMRRPDGSLILPENYTYRDYVFVTQSN
jgi:prepilin-type N-terminal cleavage/methylation domain-containing protein